MTKFLSCFLFAFAATTINAYQLDCRFENYTWWLVTHYSCTALNFDTFCDDRNITSVSGTHTGLMTNDQVGMLYIRDMHSECVPRNVSTFFKNLRTLVVYNSTVSELHGDDLLGLTFLEDLDLRWNLIETVPAKFFDHTPKLIRITFHGNKIKHFEARFLPQLTQLIQFYIGSNVCMNMYAGTPRDLRQLHALLKIQCKPEARMITNVINTIDNSCTNSTCTNIIYSYGVRGQGNDTILETKLPIEFPLLNKTTEK